MHDPLIELQDVSFSYQGVPVLEDVDLTIGEGDFVSIVGPNGGGKTTLLKIILGLIRPSCGTVRVFGRPPIKARPRIGYMAQQSTFDFLFPVNVLDVVLMGRLGHGPGFGFYSRDDRKAAMRALGRMEMEPLRNRPFSRLSGGQRQRVLLARALVSDPELLLLDEPTANVDAAIETELFEILNELNRHMTIMLVTHDLGFVSAYVRSVVCVNRRLAVHPTSSITGEMIHELYGGNVQMVRHDHRCSEEGHSWRTS
ncbi:MAG: metal ABC transporter ATP-binding protein [Thermodesulfobacteriota bacterium]